MTEDEYSTKRSNYRSLEPILIPLLVASLAIAAAAVAHNRGSLQHACAAAYALAEKNQILQAFVASSVLGLISYTLMISATTIVSWLRGRTFCSVTISNKDESFEKVIDFIGKQGIVSSGCLVASTLKKNKTWKDWRSEFLMGVRTPPKMHYQPANNNDVHIIEYAGTRILMHRQKGETVVAGWERVPMQMETLTLSSFGSRVAPLKQLIDDALKASFEEQLDELTVFVLNDMWGGSWEKALSKKPRSIESVILDEDLADGLLADARSFLQSSEWYASVGIPYRRGYLLYGPPGCGKTSFCQALAGALRLDVCMLTLTNKNLDDNGLAESLREAPPNAIVLLEDVDAVFVDRSLQTEGGGRGAGVTFSGLLNALDGVASQEGRLFFMTTNHIEKLDPALIRPGRCDVKVEVRRASRAQAAKLYSRVFLDSPQSDARAFADALPEYELSMATLQGYLLEHRGDAAGALAHVPRLLRMTKPVHVDRMSVFDHLRRVGLEGWAGLFAYHGYALKADLRGLSIDTVSGWSGFLRIDARACKRMELLLTEDARLMAEYQLIDMATAKELFMAVFGQSATAADDDEDAVVDKEDREASLSQKPTALVIDAQTVAPVPPSRQSSAGHDSSVVPVSPPKSAVCHSSDGLRRNFIETAEHEPLAKLADKLCASLTRDGKAAASIWQVRRHLQLYAHSPAEAVLHAPMLITPSPPCGVDALRIDELSTYDWLRRAGLQQYSAALEDNGYDVARSLYGLDAGKLKEEAGIKNQLECDRLAALCTASSSSAAAARTLLGFTSADYARLRAGFLDAFASTSAELAEAHASAFASSLSDGAGHGLISIWQLEDYLQRTKDKGVLAAVEGARADLVDHVRPSAPPVSAPPEPSEWVHSWLKEHGLQEYSSQLIDAKFVEKADLMLEPRLSLMELEKLGVEKAGDARKLLALIKKL